MKRSILAIFAALALTVSMPVAAQFEDQEPQQQQLQQQQQAGQDQPLTGTVIEWDEQSMILTLRTDQGIQEVRVENQGVVPQGLSQGDQVTVQARQSAQGQMVASQIQTEGAQQQQGQFAQQQPQGQQQQLQQDQQEQQFQQQQLPATGSELPLIGLLGLLSVAAAFGVRFLVR